MILIYRCGCGHETELEAPPNWRKLANVRRCPECLEWDARPIIGEDFE